MPMKGSEQRVLIVDPNTGDPVPPSGGGPGSPNTVVTGQTGGAANATVDPINVRLTEIDDQGFANPVPVGLKDGTGNVDIGTDDDPIVTRKLGENPVQGSIPFAFHRCRRSSDGSENLFLHDGVSDPGIYRFRFPVSAPPGVTEANHDVVITTIRWDMIAKNMPILNYGATGSPLVAPDGVSIVVWDEGSGTLIFDFTADKPIRSQGDWYLFGQAQYNKQDGQQEQIVGHVDVRRLIGEGRGITLPAGSDWEFQVRVTGDITGPPANHEVHQVGVIGYLTPAS